MLVDFNNFSSILLLLVTHLIGFVGVSLSIDYSISWSKNSLNYLAEIKSFDKGNKRSLFDAIEKGVNLRECISRIFQDHYHGGLMKLVVIGGGETYFYSLVAGIPFVLTTTSG